jgi:hypothetical protein
MLLLSGGFKKISVKEYVPCPGRHSGYQQSVWRGAGKFPPPRRVFREKLIKFSDC